MKNETFTPERIKAEADAFFEWDGEDRSLVTTTSCLLFAQHIAGLMQARAAQPAPVVPEGFKALLDRIVPRLDAGGPNPIDPEIHHCEWTLYQERERIHAEFAAAPAQGQQVEWRTTAVMLEQANAGLAQLNGKLRAELSALKAQQVGQEPQRCQCCGYLVTESEHRGCLRAATPQPAPSQDVAGLVKRCMDEEAAHWTGDSRQAVRLALDDAYARVLIALAAHDKQSGEKKS